MRFMILSASAVRKPPARRSFAPRCWRSSDPHLKDRNILDVIYALAIKHRLDDTTVEDEHDEEAEEQKSPSDAAIKDQPPLS